MIKNFAIHAGRMSHMCEEPFGIWIGWGLRMNPRRFEQRFHHNVTVFVPNLLSWFRSRKYPAEYRMSSFWGYARFWRFG